MLQIANHLSARLSALDLRFAKAVPPGGNWRNIPLDVPSARLEQIRKSAAAGEGSRSTYYGRLRPDRPSYTISTYYNRPGNGCFLHPDIDQHRTISHREAARLQSFPDWFVFAGAQRAVCQQIGNAVPPLLAMQVAEALGPAGDMIDVFAGAGGLSLGFKWQGWHSLAAAELDDKAVSTFNANVEPVAFVGDMNDDDVIKRLVEASKARSGDGRSLALVGGPPCQGFSTGGKRRSEDDVRNHLHSRYATLLRELRPNVFVFENVLGLLSLSKGRFVAQVIEGMGDVGYSVELWKLNAAEYGVPQRRQRLFLVGVPKGAVVPRCPPAWTQSDDLFSGALQTTVADAIADLPAIEAGEDGSGKNYKSLAMNPYQALMRGEISPQQFMERRRGVVAQLAA